MPTPADTGLFTDPQGITRCIWCQAATLYQNYHDSEWGFPVDDDRRLFEKLCLEGFQAGLSWLTILNKRENFRKAFANFDAATVANFGEQDIERLLADPGIVRHRGKIASTINNAKRALELRQEFGSIAAFSWGFEQEAHKERLQTFSYAQRPGHDHIAGFHRSVSCIEEARLDLCRPDHDVRLHAGHGHGQ
jgi:DNA-3-methyladenine glycosylase I